MNPPLPLFDLLLVLLLLWLAWRLLGVADLFQAVVLFIAFGLLLSLAWVRLQAPDLALAEAAIGAGITGALVLTALGRLEGRKSGADAAEARDRRSPVLLQGGALALFALLGWALRSLPPEAAGLAPQVAARLGESGVSSPVTAVLLNFRSYDTLLEIGVLFLAVLGAWSLGESAAPPLASPAEPLLALTRVLLPLLVLVAAYLLWLGSHAPGGAFQGGAVLAAGGILLLLAGWRPAPSLTGWTLRSALGGGFACFLAVATVVSIAGGRLLEYPPGWAYGLILFIEAALTVSIGATLTLLFAGGRPPQPASGREEREG